jgi:hypothetical protein
MSSDPQTLRHGAVAGFELQIVSGRLRSEADLNCFLRLSKMNRLNSAKLTIKMNERTPVRLKPGAFNFAEKHGMLSDLHLLTDFAIENGERIDKSGDTACHFNPPLCVEPLWVFYLGRRKQLRETHMIGRQDIDTNTLSRTHYMPWAPAPRFTHAMSEGIHGQRTNGSHGQTMPLTVAVRRHNAYPSGKEPLALLEHVWRNRCLGDHASPS